MSRATLLTGTVGGIMEAIASVIGIIWGILNVSFMTDSVTYSYLTIIQFKLMGAMEVFNRITAQLDLIEKCNHLD